MKTILKIAKSILIYFFFYISINLFFGLIYYFAELKNHLSLNEVFIYSLSGILNNEIKENKTLVILSVQRFIEMICSTVLTGYIFAYILNREPQIILPDKLISLFLPRSLSSTSFVIYYFFFIAISVGRRISTYSSYITSLRKSTYSQKVNSPSGVRSSKSVS